MKSFFLITCQLILANSLLSQTLIEDFKMPVPYTDDGSNGSFNNAAFYDDYIIVTGDFNQLNDIETFQIGKINLQGEVDPNFIITQETIGSTSNDLPAEIKILEGGEIFISFGSKLLKLDSEGKLADGFNTPVEVERTSSSFPDGNYLYDFEFLSNNKIVTRGPNGAYLLNEDGTQDLSFEIDHDWNSTSFGLGVQSDNKIIVGGRFTEINGVASNFLARFSPEMIFDESFSHDIDCKDGSIACRVQQVQILPNDEIIVSLWPTDLNNLGINKLGKDGSIDASFSALIDSHFQESVKSTESTIHKNDFLLFGYFPDTGFDIGKVDYSGNIDPDFGISSKYNITATTNENFTKPIASGDKLFLMLGEFIVEDDETTQGILFIDNSPPNVVGTVSTLTTPEETPLLITIGDLIVEDQDNEFPTDFSVTVLDGNNYTFSANEITPDIDFNGTLSVSIIVSDDIDNSEISQISVQVTQVNDPPVITGTTVTYTTPEETTLVINLNDFIVEDPDNEFPTDFFLEVGEGDGYSVTNNAIIPNTGFIGVLDVPITVNDGTDSSEPFDIMVEVTQILGLDQSFIQKNFSVYPNPTTNYVIIQPNETSVTYLLEIYDLNGILLFTKNKFTSRKKEIDLSKFSKGLYLLKISSGSKVGTMTISKK